MSEIVEYSQTEAALVELREKYARSYEVHTTEGMKEANEARLTVKRYRTSLEAKRKELKEPALRRCQEIDSEAKRITAELLKIEEPIDAAIKAEERREHDEKVKAERELAAHADMLIRAETALRSALFSLAMKSSTEIATVIKKVNATKWPEEVVAVRDEVLGQMESLRARTTEREQDDERREAERAELAQLRAEYERTESDRLAKVEAEAYAERDRINAEARAAAKKVEQLEAIAQAERDRLDSEAAATRTKEDSARREQQRRDTNAREELEAAEREAETERCRRLDARAMLAEFVRLYGALPEFRYVVNAIAALPSGNSAGTGAAGSSIADDRSSGPVALRSVQP